jgi:hypothetical protein
MHIRWQFLLRRGVWDVVADVGDVCLAWGNLGDEVESLWQDEMRWMWTLFAQGVYDEGFGAFDYFQRLLRHARCVGDISEIAYPISRYHHLRVHHWQWYYLYTQYIYRLVILQFVQHDVWHAGVFGLGKTICKIVPDCIAGKAGGIDGDVLLLNVTERPDVVQSREMVAVGMCYQQCVYVPHIVGEALLSEVGTGVYYDAPPVYLHECATPQPFVVRVGGAADGAVAAHDWYAERRACAQKSYFHGVGLCLLF